jgi:hypothetical protein
MRSKFRTTFATAAAAALVIGSAGLAVASDVGVAVVDVDAPTNAVSIEQGKSAPINITARVTGAQAGTATFEIYRDWTLSEGVFTGSNPQEFTVGSRAGGDPAEVFSTTGQVTVDAAQAAGGPYTLAVSAFDITNSNSTGAKLQAGASSNYEVTVLEAPSAEDTTPPVLTLPDDIITTATSNSQAVVNYTATAEDDFDGTVDVTCDPASGSSFPVGTTTVECSASDVAGNVAKGSFTVTVKYDFDGFFRPIDTLNTNSVKAGSAVPIKFSLSGDQGLDVFAPGFPRSFDVALPPSDDDDLNLLPTIESAGKSSLSYDATTDTYTYVWKTEKAWAGTRRTLVVKLADGTRETVQFKFK